MTALRFRNLDIDPKAPVEDWPFEGILAAVERGTLPDWRRIARSIAADPWGPVSREVEEAVRVVQPYGTAVLLTSAIASARERAAAAERTEVAIEVSSLLRKSCLSRALFAERIGTSASRLSTYETGKVAPSATLMVRMRQVACRTSRISSTRS